METKGDHLQNPDTDYKRDLLNLLSESYDWENVGDAGQLELESTGDTMEFSLILMVDIKSQLPKYLADGPLKT